MLLIPSTRPLYNQAHAVAVNHRREAKRTHLFLETFCNCSVSFVLDPESVPILMLLWWLLLCCCGYVMRSSWIKMKWPEPYFSIWCCHTCSPVVNESFWWMNVSFPISSCHLPRIELVIANSCLWDVLHICAICSMEPRFTIDFINVLLMSRLFFN